MLKQYKTQCQKISNSQTSMQVLPVLGVSYAGDTEALSVAPSKANLDLIQSIRLSIGHVTTAMLQSSRSIPLLWVVQIGPAELRVNTELF